MEFKSPKPLAAEHEELHESLKKVIALGGQTAEAAKKVAKLLHPHFLKEEEYAIPPLSLLAKLVKNENTSDMKDVLKMTDRLKNDLNEMLNEHKTIVEALKELIKIAGRENKKEAETFAEKLILHAQTEEEVLYPASILIGEYIKLKNMQ